LKTVLCKRPLGFLKTSIRYSVTYRHSIMVYLCFAI